jgi:hypothetical protein
MRKPFLAMAAALLLAAEGNVSADKNRRRQAPVSARYSSAVQTRIADLR